MSNEEQDSDEPRRVTGPASVTPSSSPGGPPSVSSSPRSAVGELLAQASGTGISVLCAIKASALLSCTEAIPGPLGMPRWLWGLAALVLIAVPTSAYQARKIVTALLAARAGK